MPQTEARRYIRWSTIVAVAALAILPLWSRANGSEDLEVSASLSGYNLLWPTRRCCAFNLKLAPSGRGRVTIHDSRGKKPKDVVSTFMLSKERSAELREVIEANGYFSLPSEVGDLPVDGDSREMTIRIGSRSKKVQLNGWPATSEQLATFDTAKREQLLRAGRVWSAIRQLVTFRELALK